MKSRKRIRREELDELFSAVDIEKVLRDLGCEDLEDGPDWIRCPCPVHRGDDPNFSISKEPPFVWACFSHQCETQIEERHPDVLSLVELIRGCDFRHAIGYLSKMTGVKVRRSKLDDSPFSSFRRISDLQNAKWADRMRKDLAQFEDPFRDLPDLTKQAKRFAKRGCDYFWKEREPGFPRKLLRSFGVGFCADWKGRDEPRATIPVWEPSGRRVVAIQGRYADLPPYPSGRKYDWIKVGVRSRHLLYPWHLALPYIREKGWAILVEGAPDFWRLWQYGLKNSLVTFGASITRAQANQLMSECGKLMFAYDDDKSGQRGSGLSDLHGRRRLYNVTCGLCEVWSCSPPTGKDPDVMTRSEVVEMFRGAVRVQ